MLNCLNLLCWKKKKWTKTKDQGKKKIQNIINITQEIIYSKKQKTKNKKQKLIKEGGNIWQRNQRKEGKKRISKYPN